MESVIFLGNGLNRLTGKVDWANLIKCLSVGRGRGRPGLDDGILSSWPLEFEKIYCERNRTDKETVSKNDLKKEIKEKIEDGGKKLQEPPESSSLIQEFTGLPVKHILTTNYDYNLEKAVNPQFRREKSPEKTKEKLFSLYRKIMPDNRPSREAGKVVWHIHGEIGGLESICLGFEHYCAQLAAMRRLLTRPHKDLPGGPYLNRFLETGDLDPCSWLTLFFTHHIHIVGLSLSLMEIDLWWLLVYRFQYQLRHTRAPKNRIIYYHRSVGQDEKLQDELQLMSAFRVETRALGSGREGWSAFYRQALGAVKTELE
jgi:hypothetical protein